MIAESYADVWNPWANAIINPALDDAGKAKVIQDSLAEGSGNCWRLMKMVEAALERYNGRLLTGEKATIADACMTSMLHNFFFNPINPFSGMLGPWLEQNFPKVKTYADNLKAEFGKHLDSRPKCPF